MHQPQQTTATPRKTWTAPRLSKLGTIADVAGAQGSGSQAAGAKT